MSNSALPIGLGIRVTYALALAVGLLSYAFGGSLFWAAVRGIAALLVFNVLFWAAAMLWQQPEEVELGPAGELPAPEDGTFENADFVMNDDALGDAA